MLIYDKAYTAIKNKYIIPLSEYSVPYRNLKKVNIKEILYSRFTSVEETGRDIFEFYFDQDILMKGLLGDIQLFYLRQLIQKQDVQECMGQGISANWNIVTIIGNTCRHKTINADTKIPSLANPTQNNIISATNIYNSSMQNIINKITDIIFFNKSVSIFINIL